MVGFHQEHALGHPLYLGLIGAAALFAS
jgi:hypothetical protein